MKRGIVDDSNIDGKRGKTGKALGKV